MAAKYGPVAAIEDKTRSAHNNIDLAALELG